MPPRKLPDAEYPMLLTTGRVHLSLARRGDDPPRRGLLAVYPESLVEINPEDAARLGLEPGERHVCASSRGAAKWWRAR